jgi:hypothetical protein
LHARPEGRRQNADFSVRIVADRLARILDQVQKHLDQLIA